MSTYTADQALKIVEIQSTTGCIFADAVHLMESETPEDQWSDHLAEIEDINRENEIWQAELDELQGPSQETMDGWAMDDKMAMYRNEY